jgi:biopolymer transport protein TolR
MRRSRKTERSFRPSSAVNVTPLVDVMLVLLVIFMVTAPMVTVGVNVDLPQTSAAQLNESDDPLIVSVDATGQVYIQETPIDGSQLIEKLKAIIGSNKDARVLVRGDKNLKYSVVMELMGRIAAGGICKVSLIADLPSV